MRGGMGLGAMARGGGPGLWAQAKPTLQSSPWVILRRLGGVIAEYHRALLFSFVLMLLAAGLQMIPPVATRYVVDVLIPAGTPSQVLLVGLALLGLYALRFGLLYWNRYTIALVSQQLVYSMAQRLFEHVQRLSLRFYERQGTGDIISRATSDVGVLQQALTGQVVGTFVSLLTMLAYAGIMLWLHWQLALLVFSTVPLLLLASYLSAEALRARYSRVQEKISGVNAVLAENITGVRVSKAFARETEQLQRFQARNRESLEANLSTATVQSVSAPLIQMISTLGTVLVLFFGARWVAEGTVSLGTLVAFVTYLTAFYGPLEDLIRLNATVQQALAAAERIFQFLDEQPEIVEKPGAIDLPTVRGEIRFEGVWFSYEPGKPVLQDINIVAPPGAVIALVGHTGSGKTSLVNLIPRFYDPERGRITLDGYDLRDLTLRSLRSHIAVVLQETFLFAGTVRENIAYGRLEATFEEIVEAAKQAHAHEFIVQLPQGYDTYVGEGGVLLSRGQRQRIALARAILRDPRILILDEATSDVDTETEVLIQQALERVIRGRTVFIIAHRLSTVRNADEIIVLDHGRIVERGRHEELLARGGVYRQLYDLQFATTGVA